MHAVMPSDLTKLVLLNVFMASWFHGFMRVSSPNFILPTLLPASFINFMFDFDYGVTSNSA